MESFHVGSKYRRVHYRYDLWCQKYPSVCREYQWGIRLRILRVKGQPREARQSRDRSPRAQVPWEEPPLFALRGRS